MHADRSRTGKQGKVPNLPEKMDSTSPIEAVERQGEWLVELASGCLGFLYIFTNRKQE